MVNGTPPGDSEERRMMAASLMTLKASRAICTQMRVDPVEALEAIAAQIITARLASLSDEQGRLPDFMIDRVIDRITKAARHNHASFGRVGQDDFH